jgi:O-antigen ligase
MPDLKIIQLVLMAVLLLSLPYSESLKTISIYSMLVIFAFQLYRKEVSMNLTLVHYGFALMIIAALASSVFAENPAKSLRVLSDIMLYSVAFLIACSISDEKHARTILWLLFISTVIAASTGLAYVMKEDDLLEISRLRNPNYVAMYLVIALSSMVSSVIFSDLETRNSRILLSAFAMITLAAAIMTVFRASFIGFAIFIVFVALAARDVKMKIIVLLVMASITAAAAFLYTPMWDKLLTTQSFIVRLSLWEHALDMFCANPLSGAGMDHFIFTVPQGIPDAGITYYDAHNLYLNIMAQTGLIGLSALILIFYGFLRKFIRSEALSGFGLSLKYGALGGFLVVFVSGIFDSTLHHEHAILFALLMGLFIANPGVCGLKT